MSEDRPGFEKPEGSDKSKLDLNGAEEVVYERRIDRRLRRIRESDRPWLRRIFGLFIILVSLFIGWRLIVKRTYEIAEMDRGLKRERQIENEAIGSLPQPDIGTGSRVNADNQLNVVSGAESSTRDAPAFLDVPTVNVISDCTKGVEAFRLLKISSDQVSQGLTTMDSIFSPVLKVQAGEVRRKLSLSNIRIRTQDGTEVRMHVVPDGESGKLKTRLFGADADGLPDDEAKFSAPIEKFRDVTYTAEIEREFLKLGSPPGQLLETETHESFSYRDKSGLQVIRVNGQIGELQVYMASKFLVCTKQNSNGRNGSGVVCKCLDRSP